MHWRRIFRNICSNWASYLVTAVVGFMLAPVVVHSLGDTGYGLWTLVLSMTGYFGLLDLGIRSSVGRFVARHLALNDPRGVNRAASTAVLMLGAGGLLALLGTGIIAWLFVASFHIDPAYVPAARAALLLSCVSISLILPLGVFSAVLIALERFDVMSAITIAGEIARAVLVVWSLHHGYGIVGLAVVALLIAIAEYSAMAVSARILYPPLTIDLGDVDWAACRELFGFSIYRFGWIVANQLIFYSDSVVIGLFLGAAAITPYAIAGSLINYGRNVVSLVTDTLSPSAARFDAMHDLAGLQRLLVLGTRMALFVTLPLCFGLLFLGRQFITLWMGSRYADSAVILAVLTIPQFGAMSQYASAFVLAGMARHRAFAYFALAEGAANVILSVVLVRRIGVIGVAWGTVIPNIVCTSVVVPWYTLRVLNMNVREYVSKAYVRPVLSAVPIAALAYAYSTLGPASWSAFIAEVVSLCGVFGVTCYFVCFDRHQRADAAGRLGSMFQREVVAHEA